MLRLPVLAPVLMFAILVAGLGYVIHTKRAPLPGRLLPKAPHTVRVDADALAAVLHQAPWVSPGGTGPVLYKVGYRSCPDCIAWDRSVLPGLLAAGVQTRILLYARRQGATALERAMAAALACGRDWQMYERWTGDVEAAYAHRYGVPPEPQAGTRLGACLEQGRQARDRIEQILAENGLNMETPALFWQDSKGAWRAFMGNNARVNRRIRRELGLER